MQILQEMLLHEVVQVFFSTTVQRGCQERTMTSWQPFPSCEICHTLRVWEAASPWLTSECLKLQWREMSKKHLQDSLGKHPRDEATLQLSMALASFYSFFFSKREFFFKEINMYFFALHTTAHQTVIFNFCYSILFLANFHS